MVYEVIIAGKPHQIELRKSNGGWACTLDGKEISLDVMSAGNGTLSLLIDGKSFDLRQDVGPAGNYICVNGRRYDADVRDPRSLRGRRGTGAGEDGPRKLVAPMPGKVVRVLAQEKSEVEAGQGIVVVEAMKMQNEIKSPKRGVVQKIAVAVGASVNAGEVLAVVE